MLPNVLTVLRLLMVPFILWLAYGPGTTAQVVALALFLAAALTDLFDGYLARTRDQITPFGTVMDPLTDKMLVLGALFVFADCGLVPMWLVLINLFREMLISGIRAVQAAGGEIVGANWMGKVKFGLQCGLVGGILLYRTVESAGVQVPGGGQMVFWATAGVTSVSVVFALNFFRWHGKWLFQGWRG